MKEANRSSKLVLEEKKAIKLLLWLFYIFFIPYDLYFNNISHMLMKSGSNSSLRGGLGVWSDVFVLALLPVAIHIIKKGNLYIVKYILLYGFIFIDTVNNLMMYLGTSKSFASGNIVELIFLFLSPVFINKTYYWSVTIGMIGKYVLVGFLLKDKIVIIPILVIVVISFIAFILINRFYSYINSLNKLHNELIQKEKLAVIGQMAAAIGHEIRNPLSSLKGFTQIQKEQFPNTNNFYQIMIQEIDRINSIVNDLLYLGKPRAIQLESANIEDIIKYTVSLTQQQAEGQSVTIKTIIEEPIPSIICDSTQLKQVFINLIKNAIEAMLNGGQITINVTLVNKDSIRVSIEDEGCGIALENISNLGEPFFTTKREGTGLGLMVTKQVINDHNGYLNIDSVVGKGTKVTITLPVS